MTALMLKNKQMSIQQFWFRPNPPLTDAGNSLDSLQHFYTPEIHMLDFASC